MVMVAFIDNLYKNDFSDLEFYISGEEFHDNISNSLRYNVQLYEVSIIELVTGIPVFIKILLIGNQKIENLSQF